MHIEEINRRLRNGEKLFCPDCDLFFNDHGQNVCEIIICEDPFSGPTEEDLVNCALRTSVDFKRWKIKNWRKGNE